MQLGDQLGIPVVVSNAVRYADPGQHRLADVLDAARLLRPIDRRAVDGGERWLKGTAEMTALAVRIAEAAGHGLERAAALLAETEETAASCTVDPVRDLGLGTPHFPEPHVVGADRARGGAMRLLRQRCEAGMTARGLDTDAAAVRQLDYELGVIGRLGYEGYFLAVAQVVADVVGSHFACPFLIDGDPFLAQGTTQWDERPSDRSLVVVRSRSRSMQRSPPARSWIRRS
ncbi:hypothetical protein AQJ27_49840 [Streptomyces olivochromogenes]|nr:hypothetical protein AQJ27_49840 [Streptomyces olivochromogenes]